MPVATKRKPPRKNREPFWINSLGDTSQLSGSMSYGELREELGREPKRKDFAPAFNRASKRCHTTREHEMYLEHCRLSKKFGSDIWRFYGRHIRIVLCTEFKAMVGRRKFWKELRALAKRHGMLVHKMQEEVEDARSWSNDTKTGELKEMWIGKEHGFLSRQVSLDINVVGWSDRLIAKFIRDFEANALLTVGGYGSRVSVI